MKGKKCPSLQVYFSNENNHSEHWSGTCVLIQNVIKIICWNLRTNEYFKFSNKNLQDDISNEIITLYSEIYNIITYYWVQNIYNI